VSRLVTNLSELVEGEITVGALGLLEKRNVDLAFDTPRQDLLRACS